MNLDKAFVTSLLGNGGNEIIREAIGKGADQDALSGDGKKAFCFVVDYLKEYGETPTIEMIEGKTGVSLPESVPGPADFYLKEVLNRRLHGALHSQISEVLDRIEARDTLGAYNRYEDGMRELRKLNTISQRTINIFEGIPVVQDYYRKVKEGWRGILTPWESINEATLGFWPEELILFVSRLGKGKTWALTMMAMHAWKVEKKRVLFITTEMAQEQVLKRGVAYLLRLPYEELRKGKLDAFSERRFFEESEKLRGAEGFNIVGGDFDFTINTLEAAIDDAEPDVIFLDGIYLLRVGGDGRTERAANAFDELKRITKRARVPMVGSTQLNREAKMGKFSSISAEHIALTDVGGWNADLIFGMIQTDEMKDNKRMIFKPIKFREGIGSDILCYWDLDAMKFDELRSGDISVEERSFYQKAGFRGKKSEDILDHGMGEFESSPELPF